ncbi:hypothetical protein [Thalassotalea marina]|uniref:Serine aminopeptidase S33 domain-containing protein n=1 Tax=Thalassotalea marina TaxID=1673741 RepID=A0A919BMX8_9GAMM|nr:hypothetical protein [Thalassotalea marina]GHF99220.1 hypothetical protein GCM10017161_29520 [Thalassotalea marina]
MKTQTAACFWQGPYEQLYLLERVCTPCKKVVVFAPPLFEDANTIRHVYTKLAIGLHQQGVSSIVFDYSGTGDSQGCLTQAKLNVWQKELEQVCQHAQKKHNSANVTLVCCHSASLILTEASVNLVDQVVFWHPEFSGKKYIKQLKRTALTQQQGQHASNPNCQLFAGYEIPTLMLDSLQDLQIKFAESTNTIWFEFSVDNVMAVSREKYLLDWQTHTGFAFETLNVEKFWQATELIVPDELIESSIRVINDNAQ